MSATQQHRRSMDSSILRSTPEASSQEGDEGTAAPNKNNLAGKTIYQRVFYRFSPGSDLEVHDAIVIEERVRFQQDLSNLEYMIPVGERTLILRDGQGLSEGEIGDEFYTQTIHDGKGGKKIQTHDGAGTDPMIESAIATAMYLASNPSLVQGKVLEVACELGLAGLLGCIGAGFVLGKDAKKKDVAQEMMGLKNNDDLLPKDLKGLFLTDSDDERMNLAFKNVKLSGVSPGKVTIEEMDWTKRVRHTPGTPYKAFHTIVASDVAFSYPQAKELARTVAHRLEPMARMGYMGSEKASSIPKFVHVCPEAREDSMYLHKLMEKGYRMSVDTGYLKLEKLTFCFQTLPQSKPESALDDLDLELQDDKELFYQSLTAQHHPDYVGEGSGELFFPMETGEYDATGGSTFLEREPESRGPW
jgi:predicted nicotinamide N-methyase